MQIKELSPIRKTIVGVQFLFVAFGSTVLVPLLIGLNPATALFTAGPSPVLGGMMLLLFGSIASVFFSVIVLLAAACGDTKQL